LKLTGARSPMRLSLLLLIAFQVACDRGVSVTYRVSMAPAEADSISQLSVAISDAVAHRHAMGAQGMTDGCSLASYYSQVGGGSDWLDFCVTREGNIAVKFHIEAWHTGLWGSRGDGLRLDVRDTLATQFGARFTEAR
jgi:hypothetical protein